MPRRADFGDAVMMGAMLQQAQLAGFGWHTRRLLFHPLGQLHGWFFVRMGERVAGSKNISMFLKKLLNVLAKTSRCFFGLSLFFFPHVNSSVIEQGQG